MLWLKLLKCFSVYISLISVYISIFLFIYAYVCMYENDQYCLFSLIRFVRYVFKVYFNFDGHTKGLLSRADAVILHFPLMLQMCSSLPSPSFSLGPLGKELNQLLYTGWCGQHAQIWTSSSLLLDSPYHCLKSRWLLDLRNMSHVLQTSQGGGGKNG